MVTNGKHFSLALALVAMLGCKESKDTDRDGEPTSSGTTNEGGSKEQAGGAQELPTLVDSPLGKLIAMEDTSTAVSDLDLAGFWVSGDEDSTGDVVLNLHHGGAFVLAGPGDCDEDDASEAVSTEVLTGVGACYLGKRIQFPQKMEGWSNHADYGDTPFLRWQEAGRDIDIPIDLYNRPDDDELVLAMAVDDERTWFRRFEKNPFLITSVSELRPVTEISTDDLAGGVWRTARTDHQTAVFAWGGHYFAFSADGSFSVRVGGGCPRDANCSWEGFVFHSGHYVLHPIPPTIELFYQNAKGEYVSFDSEQFSNRFADRYTFPDSIAAYRDSEGALVLVEQTPQGETYFFTKELR